MSTPVHGDVHEKDNDSISKVDVEAAKNQPYVAGKNLEQRDETGAKVNLHRGLSARQVQMIAIAGTIGTGLFLGTGSSLVRGGPAALLITYSITGFIVYVTLLLLGEMATQYPIAGSFSTYANRFFSPSYAFALSWNYWFNDAVSVAGDLTAAQILLEFWTPWHPWVISLLFWVLLVGLNSIHVRVYGELEYWFATLKVATIVVFIILGILVNCGVNSTGTYIGGKNWELPGAPFVNGFRGFARVFVTASFAYGGTESLGITAGETKNPSKNMPKVVKFVFWRILIFYILSVLLIGLNVPYTYPDLSTRSSSTSPFTIIFKEVGSTVAASFMNVVILTSVLSAGNHALYAGTRVLYGLSVTSPRQAPAFFSRTTKNGVPLPALLATSSISLLCFGSSYIGAGALWEWLQSLVGVSNQIAWFSIGLASWRFRKAWVQQGRPLSELKYRAGWTWPWGPPFVIISVACLILIQGWSSFSPFEALDFVGLYIQIPLMVFFYLVWMILGKRRHDPRFEGQTKWWSDLVDTKTVDLYKDEHREDDEENELENEKDRLREQGKFGWAWKAWNWIA